MGRGCQCALDSAANGFAGPMFQKTRSHERARQPARCADSASAGASFSLAMPGGMAHGESSRDRCPGAAPVLKNQKRLARLPPPAPITCPISRSALCADRPLPVRPCVTGCRLSHELHGAAMCGAAASSDLCVCSWMAGMTIGMRRRHLPRAHRAPRRVQP